ncbi:MAG: 50S ribosomal protein L13 [Methanosarcinales archaeon]|nr:50S ribosomal protein L13 [Methanosarcinales archaeon]
MVIVDATGLILGRLASVAASQLLKGEEINIVNAEKAIVSGQRDSIFREYYAVVARGSREHGPHFPKRPERILKRTVRGMLPYRTKRGREAMSKLRVYVGVPREFVGQPVEQLEAAKMKGFSRANYIELGELAKRLGSHF